ncbi:hypothetical protein BGZ82_007857 [Podila clonocystis]|nr:hypothetical protein BGZ82_007857 [Podila clonocystis]
MDLMPQYNVMEYYDQFRRFIASLEANFEFIPGVADAKNTTTLEAKLYTIHNAMHADGQRHQQARNEIAWFRALHENLTNEYNKANHENNMVRAENERLFSINAALIDSNIQLHDAKSRVYIDNEHLRAELRMLRKLLPLYPSGQSTDKENIQPRDQASLQAQLEAARHSRARDHDYIAIIKKENEIMSTRLQASQLRANDMYEELERTKSRLIEKLLSTKGSDTTGLVEMWAWYQEDIEKVQAIATEKQKEIETLSMELRKCKLSLRKAQVKIGNKNEELRMEKHLQRMGRNDRKKEIETFQSEKRRKGHGYEAESRRVCSYRCQRNKEKVKELHAKIQELQDHLDDMPNTLEDNEKKIKKMADNEAQLVLDAALANGQLQKNIVNTKKLDQERLRQIEALKEAMVRMEMSVVESKQQSDENESMIKSLQAQLEEMGSRPGELDSEEHSSLEQVQSTLVESIVQSQDSAESGSGNMD